MTPATQLSVIALFAIAFLGCTPARTPPFPQACATLHEAAVFHPEQIPALIKSGHLVDEKDQSGNTPLWSAVQSGEAESVRLLLAAGADPDIPGQVGFTPLHRATFSSSDQESITIAEMLLREGANPNAVETTHGCTALHHSVLSRSLPMVQLLLDAGADPNLLSTRGDTPLQYAVSSGNANIADLLLQSGTDPEIRNSTGFRPIDQLNACPNPAEIQDVFRKHGVDDQRRPELIKSNEEPLQQDFI